MEEIEMTDEEREKLMNAFIDIVHNKAENFYEYAIPVDYEKDIIELNKKTLCINLTVDKLISGKLICNILDAYKLTYNKAKIEALKYLIVYIDKDAAVKDYIQYKEIYSINHDKTKTFILV